MERLAGPTSARLDQIVLILHAGRDLVLCVDDDATADRYLEALRLRCPFTVIARETLIDGVLVKIGPLAN